MNKLAVITRLHYKIDDARFAERIRLYKEHTLPSLLNQTCRSFDILVWCEPHHDAEIAALHPRIKIIHAEHKVRYNGGYFIDFTTFDKVSGMRKYVAQLGLDSDDELLPEAIATIKKHLDGGRKALSLQPLKRDLRTGKMYKMRNYVAAGRLASIFCLVQPLSSGDYIFAYEDGHCSGMPGRFDELVNLEGLAIMNIHGANESTTIEERDVPA